MNEKFNICSVCDNRDSEPYGISCMVRSRSKKIDGSDCRDFVADESLAKTLVLTKGSEILCKVSCFLESEH